MSKSTITLQQVANFCSTMADLLPVAGVGGYTNEPFLSIANDTLSSLFSSPNDWKFNRKDMNMLVTAPQKQDYLFAGASAFTLGSTSQGWAIGLTTNSAITVTTGVVTVVTLETHRFNVGDTVYMLGNDNDNYNSTKTDNGSSTTWSGGWVILSVASKSFTFTATGGQTNGDISGAAGINDFGWAQNGLKYKMNDTSSPQYNEDIKTYRELPITSRVANPEKVSVLVDNGDGTVKIRVFNCPGSEIWGIIITYQMSAPLKTALTDTFAPFPDSMSSVYRQGLVYRLYRYLSSPRADAEYQKLQAEIMKAQASDDAEQSSIYVVPEEPLMDGSYWWGW